MAKRSHPRRRPLRLLAALFILLLLILFVYWDNTALQSTACEAVFASLPPGFDGCRITVLSDLHGAVFGEDNASLFAAVAAQEPDYIVLLGDLIDEHTPAPQEYAASVGERLSAIAPTFYVTGNHEWSARGVKALKSALKESGVTVLTNRALTLERQGDHAVLAGIDDPNGHADQKTPDALFAELDETQPDTFRILLAHRNDRFSRQYSRLNVDLVLSGHAHGGLVRLPFTDGLFGHNRELFPSYTSGLYEENGSTLFVSRGLGNVRWTLRLFNRPEVALLTLRRGG